MLGGTIIVGGLGLELLTCGGFTVGLGVTTATGATLIGHGLTMTSYHAQDMKAPLVTWKNTNPFNGHVEREIFVGDTEGNIIPVPKGHRLEGTKDGKWIQVKDKDRAPTGTRKDGGGHSSEKDIRGREPHGHVPGITNPDGTPSLPIHREPL